MQMKYDIEFDKTFSISLLILVFNIPYHVKAISYYFQNINQSLAIFAHYYIQLHVIKSM